MDEANVREDFLSDLYRLNQEIATLNRQLKILQQEKTDLEIMLQATTEHGDQMVQGLRRQKTDLEILLDVTTEHSDSITLGLRQQAQEERRQRDEQFQLMTAAMPVGLIIAQIDDGQILYVNQMTAAMLGLSAEDLLQHRTIDFYHDPADRQRVLSSIAQTQQFEGEILFKRADGSCFWALLSLRTFVFQGTTAFLTTLYDISDRKQAEDDLKQSEATNRALVEAIPDLLMRVHRDGTYMQNAIGMNRRPGWFDGKTHLHPTHVSEALPLAQARQRMTAIHQALQTGTLQIYEHQLPIDGQWVDEEVRVIVIGDDEVLVMVRDITDRKRAEESIRIAEENYRSIFENALEGIFQSAPAGRFLKVNPALARLYGYESPQDMIDTITDISAQIYVNPADQVEFQRQMAAHGQVKDLEYPVQRKDGSIIWIQEDTRAVRDRSGRLLYYEGMIQDITDRKLREDELRRQLAELKIEIDQNKRETEVANLTESNYFKDIQQAIADVNLDEFWS